MTSVVTKLVVARKTVPFLFSPGGVWPDTIAVATTDIVASAIHRAAFWTVIELSLFSNYRRDLAWRIGPGAVAAASASAATTALRQLSTNGVPFGVHRRDARPDRHFIRPIVRIQTLGAFHQLVPLLGAPGTAGDALQQVSVTGAESGSLGGA